MSGKAFIEQEESQSEKGGKRASRPSGSGKYIIVITELPYQANKAKMVEEIAKYAGSESSLQGVWTLAPASKLAQAQMRSSLLALVNFPLVVGRTLLFKALIHCFIPLEDTALRA